MATTSLEKMATTSVEENYRRGFAVQERCQLQSDSLTVDIGQVYPPVRGHVSILPKHQICSINEHFVAQLKRRMEKTVILHTIPFLLMIDPNECESKEAIDRSKLNEYHYYVLGGNHSLCARLDMVKEFPTIHAFRRLNAWIVVGCTIEEQRNLAWGHNIDSDFRSKMSMIDRVIYIHDRYLEMKDQENVKLINIKLACAQETHMRNFGIGNDSAVVDSNDNYFQLAFRLGVVWDHIKIIFDMWEDDGLKNQKREAEPGARKSKSSNPLPNEMKITEWRHMQGLRDENIIIDVLQRVINKRLTLQEMGVEFSKHKVYLRIQNAFLSCFGDTTSWEELSAKYPRHVSEEEVQYFYTVFANWKEPKESKRKLMEGSMESGIQTQIYPDSFISHVMKAKEWLRAKSQADIPREKLDCEIFEHMQFGDVFYQCHLGDCKVAQSFIEKRDYTLCLIDAPYGINVLECMHDDTEWKEEDFRKAVQAFKFSSTAPLWRIIILHGIDQAEQVRNILAEECNGSSEACVWVKRNIRNTNDLCLQSSFEYFTIGFWSRNGGRTMDHFNFGATEPRGNVVDASSVMNKVKHDGDRKPVNVYQKPRKLLNWMVEHFSYPGDWVVDFCSGSGTGLVSALAFGRHCVSVEIDKRQESVLKSRVYTLTDDLLGGLEEAMNDAPEYKTPIHSPPRQSNVQDGPQISLVPGGDADEAPLATLANIE